MCQVPTGSNGPRWKLLIRQISERSSRPNDGNQIETNFRFWPAVAVRALKDERLLRPMTGQQQSLPFPALLLSINTVPSVPQGLPAVAPTSQPSSLRKVCS